LSPIVTADPHGTLRSRDLVIRHLQGLGSLPGSAGVPLPLGVPGVCLQPDGSVTIEGRPLNCTERRLSTLLTDGSDFRYLADRPSAVSLYHSSRDPLLYRAVRRFLPSRNLSSPGLLVADADYEEPGHMIADLVVYEHGTLPGGEPYRSTGHWNLPGQLEIFEVLTGRIAMLVAGRNRSGERFSYVQICDAGTAMAVPFDVWHVTYVLDGPAVVFNVTTRLQEVDAAAAADKYHRADAVALTLRHARGLQVVGSPDAMRVWGVPAGPPRADWFTGLLAPAQSLADLHLHGSPKQLAGVIDAARQAYRDGWPVGLLAESQIGQVRSPAEPNGEM
jgi:oxalate decarboxylase/phosphoglucose isomerase-like protein (cupin superfamily)